MVGRTEFKVTLHSQRRQGKTESKMGSKTTTKSKVSRLRFSAFKVSKNLLGIFLNVEFNSVGPE